MKTANKSIFDKSYIVKAQAIAAGAKEWPQGIPSDVVLSRDEATKKYRWVKSTIVAGKPYLVIGGGQYAWACEDADIKVYGNTEAEALEAYKNQLAFEADLKAPANVTLAEALKESGETIEELKAGDDVANAMMSERPTNCPHCGIGLDNGISVHGDEVNGKPLFHKSFELACLGCGGEFGAAIKPRISTCERPTKRVWDIADSMPKASRKEVMAECVRQGIAYGTSRTQYQAWFKASQSGSNVEVRKPYQKGE